MSETPHTTSPEVEVDADFDAFWTSRARKGKQLRIFGRVVTLPPSLPLQFQLEAQRLQRSKRPEDIEKLVGILFGPDALAGWAADGMDIEQFQVLLVWAPRAIAGQPLTLEEAADLVAKGNAGETPDPT